MERLGDPPRPVTLRGEPLAGGHAAHPVVVPGFVHGVLCLLQLGGGEVHPVHRGHQPHRVADARRIHVVLHEPIRQHQRSDRHVLKAPGNAHVDDPPRRVQVDKQLGGHGSVHLPHAAAAGDHVLPYPVEGHARHRFFRLCALRQQALDLTLHGVQQSSQHTANPHFSRFLHCKYHGGRMSSCIFPTFPVK